MLVGLSFCIHSVYQGCSPHAFKMIINILMHPDLVICERTSFGVLHMLPLQLRLFYAGTHVFMVLVNIGLLVLVIANFLLISSSGSLPVIGLTG